MKRLPPAILHGIATLLIGTGLAMGQTAPADALTKVREATQKSIDQAVQESGQKRMELADKYAEVLEPVQKKATTDGNLDLALHVREEREAVRKDGGTTSHSDPKLLEVRKLYSKGLEDLNKRLNETRDRTVAAQAKQLQEQEVALTKSGDIDGALAMRKEREKFILEFSSAGAASAVPLSDDPRVAGGPKALGPVNVPKEIPAAGTDPFLNAKWMDSMSIPVAKQRVRAAILIGDRGKHKEPLIVIPPRSTWVGADAGRVDLSFGKVVARNASFEKIIFTGDLSCHTYFIRCKLDNSPISKGGVWYGSVQAAKFYFEGCLIKGKFSSGDMKTTDVGLRAEESVFQEVDFSKIIFDGKSQPANYENNGWMALVHCRFVKCKIPLSILMLTRECIFEDCMFMGEPEGPLNATKPYQVTLYADNCRSTLAPSMNNLKVIQKRSSDLKGVLIPTVSQVTALIEN